MLNSRMLGGVLLIAGTTIGAAMLALPLSTGLGGFLPAFFLFTFVWLLMLWVSFLMLEVNLAFEGDVNFVTMVKNTLGKPGTVVMWVIYLLLFYSLLAAYISGSGPIILDAFEHAIGLSLPTWTAPYWVLIFFCPFLYAGLRAVDSINRLLMAAMGVSFVVMVALLATHLQPELLLHVDTSYTLVSLSVVITAFGYHVIIPSLTIYLKRDVRQIKTCIALGSLLPMVVYFIWELVILGTLPIEGEFGISYILSEGISTSKALSVVLKSQWVTSFVVVFSFCAIVTSFLGVAQGLIDFLKDGLKFGQTHGADLGVFALAFLPPLGFAVFYPQGFIMALEWAGIFVAILLGIIPILMVWSLRHFKQIKTDYVAFGGRGLFTLGIMFFSFMIVLVVARNVGLV